MIQNQREVVRECFDGSGQEPMIHVTINTELMTTSKSVRIVLAFCESE
jgi:hypothetical protein